MRAKSKRSLCGILFLLPSLCGVLLFFLIPFGISVLYSFSLTSGQFKFSGIENYVKLIRSGAFSIAIRNTFLFIGIGVTLLILLGYGFAVLLRIVTKMASYIGTALIPCLLLPMMIPSAATLLLLQVLFEQYGFANGVLTSIGFSQVSFLKSNAAFAVLLLAYIWKNIGYTVTILFSGLQTLSQDMIEAAQIDGANGFILFWRFELIQMLPFCCVAAIMGIIAAFKMYRESYLLMGLYPHQSVYFLQNFLSNNFSSFNYQRLATGTVVFIILIATILSILFKYGFADRE